MYLFFLLVLSLFFEILIILFCIDSFLRHGFFGNSSSPILFALSVFSSPLTTLRIFGLLRRREGQERMIDQMATF
jgi:hypothetical protein